MATPVRRAASAPAPAARAQAPRPAGYGGAPAVPATAPAGSAYAGIQAASTRPDAFDCGSTYLLEITQFRDDPPLDDRGRPIKEPTAKIYGKILDIVHAGPESQFRVGEVGAALISLRIARHGAGEREVKAAALAIAGYDGTWEGYGEAEYDAMDPLGLIIDASAGRENLASTVGATLIGRRVMLAITPGKPREGGGFFSVYKWSAVDQADGVPTVLEVEAPLLPENWAAE